MVFEQVDLLVDGSCPCVLDGRVLNVSIAAAAYTTITANVMKL